MYVNDWLGTIRPETRHPYVHRVGIVFSAASLVAVGMIAIIGLLA